MRYVYTRLTRAVALGTPEEAVEWAVEQYKRSGRSQVGRARYYADMLLHETAKAVLADISTRIALT